MMGLFHESLKTKPQMRKMHQIKEKAQGVREDGGVQRKRKQRRIEEFRSFFFTILQLEQDTRSLETAQLEFQDTVDAKDAEAAKRGKPELRNSVIQAQIGA